MAEYGLNAEILLYILVYICYILGAGIRLKDQRWALPVERCLGGLFLAFSVDNHHDERELEKIFASVCRDGKKPSIITANYSVKISKLSFVAAW